MGNFFSTYDNETPTWGTFPQDGGQHLSEMPSSFVGGGQSGPDGQKGGPGAFKRLAKRRAAMAQRIQAISGGKGDMQSSTSLDVALGRALSDSGRQDYLTPDGGPVQDGDAGQPGNRYAFGLRTEGPYESDERGADRFPIDWRNNPHNRDMEWDEYAISDPPASAPFPYDGDNHAHTVTMGNTAGWNGAPSRGEVTSFPYRPDDKRRGRYQPDPAASEYHTDLAWTPAQKLAARLAETVPTPQVYPELPHLGESLFSKRLG